MNKLTKKDCICCLRQKAEELGRLPKKSDFEEEVTAMIKAHLGPWPRALETAGIKEPNPERILKKKEKRQRARENQKRYRREHPKNLLKENGGLE
ncbi:MAG: hypothetical protein NC293_02670 [Roseburia sp.]|nr:hypothetical protein [Roseburia sp.]